MIETLEGLIQTLARLPGLGPRSARRVALHLVQRPETVMLPLAESLQAVAASICRCEICGALDNSSPCSICTNPARGNGILCVVETVGDIWALERARVFSGRYHVLGGVLSALSGIRPEDLAIESLQHRILDEGITEIILALNATIDGQATGYYLADILANHPVRITRLAQGVPMGGELDWLDDGTLAAAFGARR